MCWIYKTAYNFFETSNTHHSENIWMLFDQLKEVAQQGKKWGARWNLVRDMNTNPPVFLITGMK